MNERKDSGLIPDWAGTRAGMAKAIVKQYDKSKSRCSNRAKCFVMIKMKNQEEL
ncbi:MAG: hypothetical protein K8I29_17285 [Alphaproteobacteria bacterium]|uniref:Uncharacterized protein n=1 Tax=Candidatus Nitrobium versatile TaxID=2884831 RepID=A0A953M2V6_9BACT|nr:hypothetical protein [Candidatus Nitrobium versatile]